MQWVWGMIRYLMLFLCYAVSRPASLVDLRQAIIDALKAPEVGLCLCQSARSLPARRASCRQDFKRKEWFSLVWRPYFTDTTNRITTCCSIRQTLSLFWSDCLALYWLNMSCDTIVLHIEDGVWISWWKYRTGARSDARTFFACKGLRLPSVMNRLCWFKKTTSLSCNFWFWFKKTACLSCEEFVLCWYDKTISLWCDDLSCAGTIRVSLV